MEKLFLSVFILALLFSSAPAKAADKEFRDCDACPVMVKIPAGSFMMGALAGEGWDDEYPQHKVTIAKAFAVSKFEVTLDEFAAFVAATGYDGQGYAKRPTVTEVRGGPAIVSWDDSQAYVKWLSAKTGKSYRLLSEAEWEYAARAGSTEAYPFPASDIAKYANIGGSTDGFRYTNPVGAFPPNKFGLYDMHGNLREWVQDCKNPNYDGAPSDGSAWLQGDCKWRMVRGGSWSSIPKGARSATRSSSIPFMSGNESLRIARAL